jgi:hypothetical protein
MLDFMRLAFEAAHAEHADAPALGGGRVHVTRGCHACVLTQRLMALALEEEKQHPALNYGSLWGLGGGNRAALFTDKNMTHAQWEMLVRLVALMEPEKPLPPGAVTPPGGTP